MNAMPMTKIKMGKPALGKVRNSKGKPMTAMACEPPTKVPTKKINAKIKASDTGRFANKLGRPSMTCVAKRTSLKIMIKKVLNIKFFSNAVKTVFLSSERVNFPTPMNTTIDNKAAS